MTDYPQDDGRLRDPEYLDDLDPRVQEDRPDPEDLVDPVPPGAAHPKRDFYDPDFQPDPDPEEEADERTLGEKLSDAAAEFGDEVLKGMRAIADNERDPHNR